MPPATGPQPSPTRLHKDGADCRLKRVSVARLGQPRRVLFQPPVIRQQGEQCVPGHRAALPAAAAAAILPAGLAAAAAAARSKGAAINELLKAPQAFIHLRPPDGRAEPLLKRPAALVLPAASPCRRPLAAPAPPWASVHP